MATNLDNWQWGRPCLWKIDSSIGIALSSKSVEYMSLARRGGPQERLAAAASRSTSAAPKNSFSDSYRKFSLSFLNNVTVKKCAMQTTSIGLSADGKIACNERLQIPTKMRSYFSSTCTRYQLILGTDVSTENSVATSIKPARELQILPNTSSLAGLHVQHKSFSSSNDRLCCLDTIHLNGNDTEDNSD